MTRKSVLGVDLGTSAVKLLQRFSDGTVVKEKERYEEISPKGWWDAILRAMSRMELASVEAIGLSSQVGTYIVDDKEVISWNDPIGAEELTELKQTYSQKEFLAEISMPHPTIISYPLPRLMYIKKMYPAFQKVCQPKDFICEKLTGKCVTDPYSWRGLANLNTKIYSKKFLKDIGIEEDMLPQIIDFKEVAGNLLEGVVPGSDLREGIPVYVGLNDYYASLLGMGIWHVGDMFDITGTSEHLGILEDRVDMRTEMVSGPYLRQHVHYGVTGSSGASLDFGLQFSETGEMDIEETLGHNPPIFLPYVKGERAPIWDGNARGVYFGIQAGCSKEDMAYAVLEGVSFSLYHIYEKMGKPEAKEMRIAGGAAVNRTLGRLKAELFGIPVKVLKEHDTSALGACMVAELGIKWYQNEEEAMTSSVEMEETIYPTGKYQDILKQRFAVYKELYPALKDNFKQLGGSIS